MATLALFGASGATGRRVCEAADREHQEAIVRESGLRWTIVKPPRLTESARRPVVHPGSEVRVGLLSSVSRLDLARLIVDEIEAPRFAGQAVFVAG